MRNGFTVGEVISMLVKYCSDEDEYLLSQEIYGITVNACSITVEVTDANTQDIVILSE